jgi:hypothetical protein
MLGLKSKKLHPKCIEAALVGFIQSTILKPRQVLISDRTEQFAPFNFKKTAKNQLASKK